MPGPEQVLSLLIIFNLFYAVGTAGITQSF